MAEKRMFTKKITESDAFLDMPLSAQCLYFHLNMCADDDGFVNAPKKIQRLIGAKDDDLKILIMKSFLLMFEHGVVVIKHWRMHNTIRQDRYHPTDYQEEFKSLGLKSNGSYSLKVNGNQMATECIPSDTSDISLDTDIDLDNKEEIGKEESKSFKKPTLQEIKDYCIERKNGINPKRFYNFYESKNWMIGKNKMKNWKACIRTWEQRDKTDKQELPSWFDKEYKRDEDGLDELEKILEEFNGNVN